MLRVLQRKLLLGVTDWSLFMLTPFLYKPCGQSKLYWVWLIVAFSNFRSEFSIIRTIVRLVKFTCKKKKTRECFKVSLGAKFPSKPSKNNSHVYLAEPERGHTLCCWVPKIGPRDSLRGQRIWMLIWGTRFWSSFDLGHRQTSFPAGSQPSDGMPNGDTRRGCCVLIWPWVLSVWRLSYRYFRKSKVVA